MRLGLILSIGLLSILTITSCSKDSKKEFISEPVEIKYDKANIVDIKKPENLNSRDEFTEFLDYVIFYGEEDKFIYTTISDSYKKVLLENQDYEARWAGQYGELSHNFLIEYDFSRVNENIVGAYGYFFEYATLKNDKNEYTSEVLSYTYYNDILSTYNNRGYKLNDFYLYKNNKGYLRVNNSEGLFYAISKGYMPYIDSNNTKLLNLFSEILGILNRILKPGMSDLEKYEAMYTYIQNEVLYDYKMLNNKEGNPRLYRCYYLEGAVFDKLATCDGLTKLLSVFCGMEGIPTMHVGAVSYHGGHAYNYTLINDKYYLSCVTSSQKIENFKGMSFINHTNLYFLSDLKPSPSFEFDSEYRVDIKNTIDTKYNYWANKKINIDGIKYSLEVNNKEAGLKILAYLDRLCKDNKISLSIELLIDYDTYLAMKAELNLSCDYNTINNGIFNNKKLYSFIILGE